MDNLLLTSFTGVDERCDISELSDWQQQCANENIGVEFGVLLSYTSEGEQNKYPCIKWIEKVFLNSFLEGKSLHICGKSAVADFIKGRGAAAELSKEFPTVQLNFKFDEADLDELLEAFERNSDSVIITQHNKNNKELWHLVGYDNHAILFDDSGGRGFVRTEYPEPIVPTKVFGYAGGLGPDNISEEMPKILEAANGNIFWIDMETNIRSNDWFDLAKCTQVVNKLLEF